MSEVGKVMRNFFKGVALQKPFVTDLTGKNKTALEDTNNA